LAAIKFDNRNLTEANMIKFSSEIFHTAKLLLRTFAVICIGLTAISVSHAAENDTVFVEAGVAIRGVDAVAYFTQGERVDGSADFTAEHGGGVWQFSSVENRDLFVADPTKYVPAYGGYCAYALSLGTHKVATDPDAWTIVDGRLYLNKTLRMRTLWQANIPARIEKADANWAKLTAP
jgi:YHS domain-containing protein